MRKIFMPALVAASLTTGGCAVVGNVLGPGGGGSFQNAAVEACRARASQYGEVLIHDVQRITRDTLRVYGTVDRRGFACDFHRDGRIINFQI